MDEFGGIGWALWFMGLGRQVLSIAIAMTATYLLLHWFDLRNERRTGRKFSDAMTAVYDGNSAVAWYYGLRWGLTFLGAATIMR